MRVLNILILIKEKQSFLFYCEVLIKLRMLQVFYSANNVLVQEENSENSSDEENQIEFITDCCKYDDQESFIQCDRCFSWKHTNCEKIDESSVKMEDQYVCNVCRFPKSVRK